MPVLAGIGDMAHSGCLVKPLFYTYVLREAPATLNLMVSRPVRREPDGWFHASQHPLATDRELWLWLTGQAEPEEMDYTSMMSVMFGSLGHAIVESFLDWMGASVPLPPGDCPACGRPRKMLRARPDPDKYCTEHGFADHQSRSRCHLDAILDLGAEPLGFDFKSIYVFGFKAMRDRPAIRDMDSAQFRERWPRYWAQMQECMRLSGLRKYIVFFLTMGMPWDTREFHFDYDEEFAEGVADKYRAVLSHYERGVEIIA
jgi:hypothetical protein